MRKATYSKLVVACVVVLNVAFAACCLAINWSGYDVSPSLIVSWFAFTGTELVSMAGIKVTKIRHGADDAPTENDTDNRTLRGERDEAGEEEEEEEEEEPPDESGE